MTHDEPQRLRVVHLVLSLEVGGLEMVVLNLAQATDRRVVDLRVLCLEGKGALAPRLEQLGVPVEALKASTLLGACRALIGRLRELDPQVLHTHNLKPHIVGALARRFAGTPVLVHTRHGRNEPLNWRSVLYSRLASAASDAIVAVSEDAAMVVRGIERVAPDRVVIIRNGVDLTQTNSRPLRVGSDLLHGVCVARFEAVKDHATLLRATRRIVDVQPSFRLVLVGDGNYRPQIESLIADLRLGREVSLIGRLSDVRAELRKADIFLLSSRSEGISIAILEAMASSLPVVATDVGGNRELIVHGETGLLVPPESPGDLAGAVLSLLADRDRAHEMGGMARKRAEEFFDLRETARKYVALYRELLQRCQGDRGDLAARGK